MIKLIYLGKKIDDYNWVIQKGQTVSVIFEILFANIKNNLEIIFLAKLPENLSDPTDSNALIFLSSDNGIIIDKNFDNFVSGSFEIGPSTFPVMSSLTNNTELITAFQVKQKNVNKIYLPEWQGRLRVIDDIIKTN